MRKAELKKALAEYQQINAQIAELEKQRETLAGKLKRHMEREGLEQIEIDGTKARYSEITTRRFDSKAFRAIYDGLYLAYCRPQTTRRFTVA